MQVPQIRITSQRGEIQINIQKPMQTIEQPAAEVSLRQQPAEISIESAPAQLSIDQTKAWEDMNLKHVFRLIEEAAQKGHQDALGAIAKQASEGDELMRIENGSNALASQADRNSHGTELEFNIGWVPSPGSVKVYFTAGKVDIKAKTHAAEVTIQANKVRHHYKPGDVQVSMKQQPSLTFDVIK
ncbi:DUF6470 family protein [Pseudobacillus wudalianchiensis]|uniref:YviE n=1 Tax=Pseudobacillus wudalianchiensis TaxID=1743143 RepID=A0A1B9AYR7_9BACI|nr:DUF6470 family protein [Bacillus wudalianchiensis]OCA89022.1 hypothetical protein A8F95_06300 [Bacillus wudalianchiensis]